MSQKLSTVPASKLGSLSTEALIEQYTVAISSYAGRLTNCSPRQVRINRICDMLLNRAECGDETADKFFASSD